VSTEYENHNRKHDINVMIINIEVLRDFVNKKL
jgi:hypothetical protein